MENSERKDNMIIMEPPKKFIEGEELPNFTPVYTGQLIMIFATPKEIIDRMNTLYDDFTAEKKLPSANAVLVGKIKEQDYLYKNDDSGEEFNFIPDDIHKWIKERIHQYLDFTKSQYEGIKTNSIWVNNMKAKEYNPIHEHMGSAGVFKTPMQKKPYLTGLVGLMALKIPEDMGDELGEGTERMTARNGHSEFIGHGHGAQFSTSLITLLVQQGMFIVHPYDMRHCVYPHFNENETRRTCSTNIDVYK